MRRHGLVFSPVLPNLIHTVSKDRKDFGDSTELAECPELSRTATKVAVSYVLNDEARQSFIEDPEVRGIIVLL